MSEYLQDEGLFLAKVIWYEFQASNQSESIAIHIEFEILGQAEDGELNDKFAGILTSGSFWIVGHNGELLVHQLEALKTVGWSGDIVDIPSKNWTPPVVKILVQEEYGSKSYFNAVAIYPEDWERSGAFFHDKRTNTEIVDRYASEIKTLLVEHLR